MRNGFTESTQYIIPFHEMYGDHEYREVLNLYCHPLMIDQLFDAQSRLKQTRTELAEIKNRNYALFKCRCTLSDIVDQASFSSQSNEDIADINNLVEKMKSFAKEMSDNLKTTNECASHNVRNSNSCNDFVSINEAVPYVCRTISTRIAYLQQRERAASGKKATEKMCRDGMSSRESHAECGYVSLQPRCERRSAES